MQPFVISCETCHSRLKVSSTAIVGQILPCPKCRSMVQVTPPPTADPVPVPDPPPTQVEPARPTAAGHTSDPASTANAVTDAAAWTAPAQLRARRIAVLVSAGAIGVVCGGLSVAWWLAGHGHPPAPVAESRPTPPRRTPSVPPAAASASVPVSGGPGEVDPAEAPPPNDETPADPLPPLPDVPAEQPPAKKGADVQAETPIAPATVQKAKLADTPRTAARIAATQTAEALPRPLPAGDSDQATALVRPVRVERLDPAYVPPDAAKQLSVRIPRWRLSHAPLCAFFDDLAFLSGVPITVDAESLAAAGVSVEDPVSIDISNRTLDEILVEALSPSKLQRTVHPHHVSVAAPTGNVEQIACEVEDLVSERRAPVSAQQLADVLQALVVPASWDANGGTGNVRVDGTTLHIRQTPEVQFKTLLFLERLRAARRLPPKSQLPTQQLQLATRTARLGDTITQPLTFTFVDWTTLDNLRRQWQRMTGVTLLVDWPALADFGLLPTTRVKASIVDRPLGEALAAVLDPLHLTWIAVDDTVLQITSREKAFAAREVEFYDVSSHGPAAGSATTLRERVKASFGDDVIETLAFHFDQPSGRLLVSAPQPVQRTIEAWLNHM